MKVKYVLMNEAGGDESAGGGGMLSTEAPSTATGGGEPSIERPEWVLDKYATEGRSTQDAISEQAKAYVELQKQFGGFTGAPESYELAMPEGIDGEIDAELQQYKDFLDLAKDRNMSNETAQDLFNLFVGYQQEMDSALYPPVDELKSQLGDGADQLLGQVNTWLASNVSPESYQAVDAVSGTMFGPAVLKAFNEVISKTRNSPLPNSHETAKPPGMTVSEFNEAVGSERYQTDAAYRAEIRKKAALLFPGVE